VPGSAERSGSLRWWRPVEVTMGSGGRSGARLGGEAGVVEMVEVGQGGGMPVPTGDIGSGEGCLGAGATEDR
jgi:hypothetical protein